MIDERELTVALERLAAAYDLPENGPQAIREAAGESGAVGPAGARVRGPHRLVAAAAVVAVLALGAAVVNDAGDNQAATRLMPAANDLSDESGMRQARGGQDQPQGQDAASAGATAGATTASATAAGATGAMVVGAGGPATGAVAEPGARVVKTADVQVEVGRGRFEASVERLSVLAVGRGGFVARAETSEGRSAPSGTITVRVPAGDFDAVIVEVRRLGKVVSASSRGQDVTAEYLDVEARLRGLNASRDQILTVLSKANTVGDILAVQERLNAVQVQIEQLQGQQRLLDDQTTFGTIAVHLAEPGADLGGAPEREGLAGAWHDARRGFVDGLEAIIRGSGTALIVVLSLGALGLAGRGVWLAARRRMI